MIVNINIILEMDLIESLEREMNKEKFAKNSLYNDFGRPTTILLTAFTHLLPWLILGTLWLVRD